MNTFRDTMGSVLRPFRSRGWFSVLALVSLGLGIGVNAAVATAAYGVFIRPLPYANPSELVHIWRAARDRPSRLTGFFAEGVLQRQLLTPSMVLDWRGNRPVFADLAVVQSWQTGSTALVDLIEPASVERLRGAFVTPNLFDVLGVALASGRPFGDADNNTVILSDGFSRRRFGSANVIGSTLTLAYGRERQPRPFTIIGVLPPRFQLSYPEPTDLLLPLHWSTIATESANSLLYQVIARLSSSVSAAHAQRIVEQRYRQRDTDIRNGISVWLEPVQARVVADVRSTVYLCAGMSVIALIIACLNTATVFAASLAQRRRDIAIRLSLGATRLQVAADFAREMCVIAGSAAILATAITWTAVPAIRAVLPIATPRLTEIQIHPFVLISVACAGLFSVVIAGIIPAVACVRWTKLPYLESERSSTMASSQSRIRTVVIAAEIALVWLLLCGSGLLIKTYYNLNAADLGFDPRTVVTVEMRLLNSKYRTTAVRLSFEDELRRALASSPGVVDVAIATAPPFRGTDPVRQLDAGGHHDRVLVYERAVSRNYFDSLGIRVVEGQLFDDATNRAGTSVVVSESLARRLYPGATAIGKSAGVGGAPIVGVVADIRTRGQTFEAMPAMYVSRSEARSTGVTLIVKGKGSVDTIAKLASALLHRFDPGQPLHRVASVEQILAESIGDQRLYAFTSLIFGSLMLLVSAVGIGGIAALSMNSRVKELAIRSAVGSAFGNQAWILTRSLAAAVAIGIFAGSALTFAVFQSMRHLIFGVDAFDPTIHAITLAIVMTASAVAIAIPLQTLRRLPIARLLTD